MNALADNLVNAVVFQHEQAPDLPNLGAWLQLAEDGKELFIDGKPYAATEQGRSVLVRLNAFREQEEAKLERGTKTMGKDASEIAAQDLIYRVKKAKADAAAAVRDGKDPEEYIAIFNDVYAEATDPENKVLHSEHRVDVLDVLTLSREQADRYLTSISIDDEQDDRALEIKNNWTAILRVGSGADNRHAGLPLLLKGIGYDIGDYKVKDPTETGPAITNPKIFPLADMASSMARKDVLAELRPLNKEELATALEQKPIEARYKEAFEKYMEPLMLNEFGDPKAPPAGLTQEQWAGGKAQVLEQEQGAVDLLDGDGKIQQVANTVPFVERAFYTFRNPATYAIAKETNSPAALQRLAMQTSNALFNNADYHQELGRALAAGPKSTVDTHVKVFGAVNKIGIPMSIHRNGGLFEFTRIEKGPGYYTAEYGYENKYDLTTHPHSIDFNAPTKQFPNGRFSDIRTSKESIYNMEAIRWYVSGGRDAAYESKLRELAEIYGLPPEPFIKNQAELYENLNFIDPQPKPE